MNLIKAYLLLASLKMPLGQISTLRLYLFNFSVQRDMQFKMTGLLKQMGQDHFTLFRAFYDLYVDLLVVFLPN